MIQIKRKIRSVYHEMLKRKRSTRLATFVHIPFIKSIIYETVSKLIMLSQR